MNQFTDIQPADPHEKCQVCGRKDRKLYLTDGLWMGQSCRQDWNLFKIDQDPNSIRWMGYEKQYNKIARMNGVKETKE